MKNQNGVSLIVALLILLVLTLIGITAISTTTFETNIAGNQRLYNRAFYSSDSGVDYFMSRGNAYISVANTAGTLDSRADGIALGGDYFLVNWQRRISSTGPPQIFEFRIFSEGISPNFPTAGRVTIESVMEVVDLGPPQRYSGEP